MSLEEGESNEVWSSQKNDTFFDDRFKLNWKEKRYHIQEDPEATTDKVCSRDTGQPDVVNEMCLKRVGWILEENLWKPSKGEFTFNVKGSNANIAFEQGSGKMKSNMAE